MNLLMDLDSANKEKQLCDGAARFADPHLVARRGRNIS